MLEKWRNFKRMEKSYGLAYLQNRKKKYMRQLPKYMSALFILQNIFKKSNAMFRKNNKQHYQMWTDRLQKRILDHRHVFILKQIIEKHHELHKETHIAFVGYVKAFDNALGDRLWEIMGIKEYPEKYSKRSRNYTTIQVFACVTKKIKDGCVAGGTVVSRSPSNNSHPRRE